MHILNKEITNRTFQLILGYLWLLDGLLQLQRQMFTSNFANQVIATAASGQPRVISGPMHLAIHLFLLNPKLFNSLAALTQLAIGFLILNKKSVRVGLVLSIIWGLFVWYIGEGIGGIAGLHTILLMGAPGAALIYVILAASIFPKKNKLLNKSYPSYWLVFAWLIFWVGGAIYMLLPGQNSVSDLSTMIGSNAQGLPGWLASLDIHTSNVLSSLGSSTTSSSQMHMSASQMSQMGAQQYGGFWLIIIFVVIQLAVGTFVLFGSKLRKYAIYVGIILSLIFWVIGQSFGGIFTGLGTDPNSGPLFIILGIAILAIPNIDKKLSDLLDKIESILT